MPDPREPLGRIVREAWVAWAIEQGDTRPSHLVGWDDLDEGNREADMRIGAAVAAAERDRVRELAGAWREAARLLRKGTTGNLASRPVVLELCARQLSTLLKMDAASE